MHENEPSSPAQTSTVARGESRQLVTALAWVAGWALGTGVVGYLTLEWLFVHIIVWWLAVTLVFVRWIALRLAAIGVVLGLTAVLAYVYFRG